MPHLTSPAPNERETFSSAWGAVLVTAGTAIGLGNVWRFPYMMGTYGGASFLIFYLVIVVAFGIPGLMAEWALGRTTRRGPMGAFQRSGVLGGPFWAYLLLVTVTMAASYYAVVIAWVLEYAVIFTTGGLTQDASTTFGDVSGEPVGQIPYFLFVALSAGLAVHLGVRKGIERVSKLILPVFFLLFLVLIIRTLTLDGAGAGLKYFWLPRWDQLDPRTALAALGQAFFSLALGGTFMVIYGSYMKRDEDIPRNAVFTAVADVAAAVMAGLIVVPAVVALGIDLSSGPPLLFVTMPQVFDQLPAGDVFGALFFFSVFVVALLSLIASYEVIVASLADHFGRGRGLILAGTLILQFALAIPAMSSQAYLALSDLVWGSTMQPLGAALALVALAWFVGQTKTLEELRRNASLPIPLFLFYWIKYVVPTGIIGTLLVGWFG